MGDMTMKSICLAFALLCVSAPCFGAAMMEMKGLRANEGCLEPPKAAGEKLRTCLVEGARLRIWCPSGRVFDRDVDSMGIAILRSVCEMSQVLE